MPTGRVKDFAGILFVLLSGLVLTYKITQRIDVVATDDDVYFHNGLLATWHQLPPIQMAPLFSAWYLLIHSFTGDVIDTYYVNCTLLSVLPGLLFYFLFRSLRVNVLISAVLSICFLFCQLNLPLQPKVSVFTMLFLMGGLIAANYQTTPVRKLTVAAFSALLAAYGRPEFFLSFLLLCGIALACYAWQRRRIAQPVPYSLIGIMGLGAALVLIFGSPLAGGRSVIAFGQHFALNYSVWHPEIPASPWMHSGTFIKHGFGREVTSMSDAFFLNPALFMRHIGANIANLIKSTGINLFDILIRPWLSLLVFPGRRYVLIAIVVALVGLTNWTQTVRNVWQGLREHGWYWLCVAVMLVSTYISCILIYPREHYILFQIMLYLSLVGVVLQAFRFRSLPIPSLPWVARYAAFSAILLLFLAPYWRADNQPQPTPTVDLLRFLQKIPVKGPISMTGNAPLMYDLYLGDNWKFWYLERYHPDDMQAFFKQFTINCIHVRPDMLDIYQKDPFFANLIANPTALDFVRYNTDKPDQYVLVQRQLPSVVHTPHPH
ncbi:hypothetical protein [uncultured Fibrella sp.]|uniref:hypothetical protein n=1 Tax=uncultured Fibrella sp. TaxID=1284596 RepID=UPI0035CAAF7A